MLGRVAIVLTRRATHRVGHRRTQSVGSAPSAYRGLTPRGRLRKTHRSTFDIDRASGLGEQVLTPDLYLSRTHRLLGRSA